MPAKRKVITKPAKTAKKAVKKAVAKKAPAKK
ncbi:MAG TPA: CopG family transcriptional regulator, partial [Rhodospirillales bacterium]|nr:CopG family transcriptional regulator [Rhodospirillales bacterium]